MLWVSKMFVIPDQLWMLITILSQLEDTEHFRCTANFNKCLHCWTFVFVELFSNYFKSTVFKQKLNQPTLRPNTMMVDGWHPAIRSYYWGCVPGGKHHWTMIGLLMEKDQQGEKIGTTRGANLCSIQYYWLVFLWLITIMTTGASIWSLEKMVFF